jgi:Icc-related predicted phosphoesterase
MRILAFSDLHRDARAARSIVRRSADFDVIVGAGDFGSTRKGLAPIIDILRTIDVPAIVVPGNAESDEELLEACAGWSGVSVLHGTGVELGGVSFFGLGAAVPVTPFGSWSFDLSEEQAAGLLEACPPGAVLVSHSPPHGAVDRDSMGRHLGSRAVAEAIARTGPRLVICGHIHAAWGGHGRLGDTLVVNAGPGGIGLELGEPTSESRLPPR